jgi:TPR repeat protein
LSKRPAWLFSADACPADVIPWYEQKMTYLSEPCEADLGVCVKRCEIGESNGCYAAALRVQQLKADSHTSEALFLRGCRLGSRSACTNRAAGILHLEPERPGGEACAAKTFERTCKDEDPWGCAMLGLCLAKGVGITPDVRRSLEVLPKACRLSEEDQACISARKLLKQIEAESHPRK